MENEPVYTCTLLKLFKEAGRKKRKNNIHVIVTDMIFGD